MLQAGGLARCWAGASAASRTGRAAR